MTQVGPPSSEATLSRPPASSARSRIPVSPNPARTWSGSNPRPSSCTIELHLVGALLDPQAHVLGTRVLDRVAERFLHDAVDRGLGVAGQALLGVQADVDLDREARDRRLALGQRLDRRAEPEVVECSRAQFGDQVAQLAHLLAEVRIGGVGRPAQRAGIVAGEPRGQDHPHPVSPWSVSSWSSRAQRARA